MSDTIQTVYTWNIMLISARDRGFRHDTDCVYLEYYVYFSERSWFLTPYRLCIPGILCLFQREIVVSDTIQTVYTWNIMFISARDRGFRHDTDCVYLEYYVYFSGRSWFLTPYRLCIPGILCLFQREIVVSDTIQTVYTWNIMFISAGDRGV